MKKNALISSILTIALCVSLIAGSTFALFTSDDTINVAVNAAKVKVVAKVGEFETYSMDVLQPAGTFANTGTAAYDEATGKFTLTNIAPGDKVEFPINITNDSNINIQYRVKWTVEGDLVDALVATVDGVALTSSTSDWALWKTDDTKTKTLNVSVELPVGTLNDYQEKTANVAFVVEAVQGNAIIEEITTAEQLAVALKIGATATLMNDIVLEEGDSINVPEGTVSVLDLGNYSITGNISKSEGHVIDNDGTLTIIGGTINSTAPNGGSAIRNDGVITVNGTTINGATAANGGWPAYAINHYGSMMTVNDATITSNHGAISAHGDTEVNNTTVTLNGFGGSSHLFYIGGEGTDVVINSGTYEHKGCTDGSLAYIMTGTKLTINGGTYTATDGGYGHATYTGELVVNGGTFNNAFLDWGGPITVFGGTFKTNPSAYLADGFEATLDNGLYTVAPGANTKVIRTAADLISLGGAYQSGVIALMNDVDMNGAEIKTIGVWNDNPLRFAGNGHTISNAKIVLGESNATGAVGLFNLRQAYNEDENQIGLTISNLKLSEIDVEANSGSDPYAAVLIAYCEGNAKFDNVDIDKADVIGMKSSGILVGQLAGTAKLGLTATGCDVTDSTVTLAYFDEEPAGHYAGKAIGTIAAPANITDCSFDVAVGGSLKAANVGDIYGRKLTDVTIDGETVAEVSDTAALKDAVASGAGYVILDEGTYTVPSIAAGKEVTISGTKDTVVNITNTNTAAGGSTLNFMGVTIAGQSSGNYAGLGNGTKANYTDCKFTGKITLYGATTFNNCVFENTGDYSIWTWGAGTVEFNNCTFNSDGRALMVYANVLDNGTNKQTVILNKCTFNDSTNGASPKQKAAIEVGDDYGKSYDIIINDIEVNGFVVNPVGESTGTNIWANKNSLGTDRLNVVIDDVDVH